MKKQLSTLLIVFLLAVTSMAAAQEQAAAIPAASIASLQEQLAETGQVASAARKKLAIRRVIREGDALVEQNSAALNRFEVLDILFRAQQGLVGLEDNTENRKAFLDTCRLLAAAPDEYAAIRLDADLLLSQAELAREGGGLQQRADALRGLVKRYQDTKVEAKVIRIAMVMAVEFGDAGLIQHLSEIIAQRFPTDLEMINFQQDKLTGQVFGAPFVGRFELADGGTVRMPMDYLGMTTAIYFWSKDDSGLEDLKELAAAWKQLKPEDACRIQFVSMNLDDLPDAGKSVLRELGLDWSALKLPGGRNNMIFKTYARFAPKILTVSPTGYAAIFVSDGRAGRGHERNLGSLIAREWTSPVYTARLQSIFIGEPLIVDVSAKFDPAAPPEWKAVSRSGAYQTERLKRSATSVPEAELEAIQACFFKPPLRYQASLDEVRAGYNKANELCERAIATHSKADNLWIVRNRRIIALMGLWNLNRDLKRFQAAVTEAQAVVDQGYPVGTDVVARFCLARHALHSEGLETAEVISKMIQQLGGKNAPGPALAAAANLALDTGDRKLHERYRRDTLDKHADDPMLWTTTAFFLDRYQRYWLYQPPFVAGWTYGRREEYILSIGTPDDAQRPLQLELKTLEGQSTRLPEDSKGKWTVIEFVPNAKSNLHLNRHGVFIKDRPFDDVNMMFAVLNDDAQAVKAALSELKKPNEFPTLIVPSGMDNPIVQKLGILPNENKSNIAIIRPDGNIAVVLTSESLTGDVVQNVIEYQDEKEIDEALARNDLKEAKRLAFAYAPVEQLPPMGAPKNWKPKPISITHLRSRAKVYLALGEWDAALSDAEQVYLFTNSQAGGLSMRTEELQEAEKLKATIISARRKQSAEN